MKTYIISYDLIKGGDYEALINEIKVIGQDNFWHCLESVWIINSTLTSLEICRRLILKLDSNDKIIVSQIHGPNTAWRPTFSENCQDWLKNNLLPVQS